MINQKNLTKPGIVFTLAMVCCFLWGSAFPAVKVGYRLFNITGAASQILFAGYRFALAGIMTIVMCRLFNKNIPLPNKNKYSGILLLGIVQTALNYAFFYMGLANTTGVNGSIVNSTSTFLGIIAAHFVFKDDKMSLRKAVGCCLGMMGVIAIQGKTLVGGFNLYGDGFVLVSALATAFGTLITRKISSGTDPMVITGFQLTIGGGLLILLGVLFGGTMHTERTIGILLFLYLALISSIGFSLWTLLLKYNAVGTVTVYGFMIPVFGVVLSGIFLGENILNFKTFISLILVSGGIWAVNWGKK